MHIELLGKWKPAFSFWYSTNEQCVRQLLTSRFEPKINNGKAFWNVFLARMNRMRPVGLPVWCGIDSWFIVYSIYVSTTVEASGTVNGLYVVGSQADPKHVSKLQSVLTNLFVQPAEINLELQGWLLQLEIQTTEANILQINSNVAAGDFESTSFDSFSAALDFFKYRRRFIAFNSDFVEFSDLTDQKERRIVDIHGEWKFLSDLRQDSLKLELATRVEPADFHWVAGRRERLVESSALSIEEPFLLRS